MRTLLMLCLGLLASTPAFAVEDLDGDTSSRAKRRARDTDRDIVREIERGYYLKGGAGATQYVGSHRDILAPVMALNLAVGHDFVDKERMSMSWEVVLNQALHNGPGTDMLPGLIEAGAPLIQGDVHTFAGLAFFEASTYLTRRFGLGARAGGGIMVVPVLMYDDPTGAAEGYTKNVVSGAWGGATAAVHNGPLPVIAGGPTIEYYTKLSHFSVGVDVDITYVINLDLGISPYGYLKYTF